MKYFEYHPPRRFTTEAFLLFLIGLFSQTQINIGGKIGISELVLVMCAPFVFIKNFSLFRREKILYFFVFALLWLIGAFYVDIATHNNIRFMMRGMAVPIVVFASTVCIYVLLRKEYENLKWFLLGSVLSGVICIFIFQQGTAGDLAAAHGLDAGVERVVGYKLFWVIQLTAFLTLPISGWYLKVPKVYSIVAMSFLAVFDLSTGGRSAFLCAALSCSLLAWGGKSQAAMVALKKHMFIVVVGLLAFAYICKVVYKEAALSGWMGDAESDKFEHVTNRGESALALLMSSRSETFIGLLAALDKPFVGHGSVAIDEHGYVLDFVRSYGSNEEVEQIVRNRLRYGFSVIPAHSHIVTYWMWHGVFALMFWVGVLILTLKTFFQRLFVYPPWFGYFAVSIPLFLWDFFFSPFGMRVQKAAMFAAFLLVSKMSRECGRAHR